MTMHILETPLTGFMIENEESFGHGEIRNEGISSEPYARCIATSQRVRWDIDKDVIRGRTFDIEHKFLPDGLSKVQELEFLTSEGKQYLSQIRSNLCPYVSYGGTLCECQSLRNQSGPLV